LVITGIVKSTVGMILPNSFELGCWCEILLRLLPMWTANEALTNVKRY
jgi:hypothetical protein